MNQLEELNPWPTILRKKYDFDFENKLKDKVISSLKASDRFIKSMNIPTLEKSGGVTSVVLDQDPNYSMPHEWPEFVQFGEFVKRSATEVVRKWHCNPACERAVMKSWINVHPQGGYTDEHMHHGVLMAVAAYLHVPKNGGNLLVKNPLNPYKFGEPIHHQYFSEYEGRDGLEWTPIKVETGDVLFFPGWLQHKTEKNMSKELRFVMSWNVSYATDAQMEVAYRNKYSKYLSKNIHRSKV
tara:strand:- start:197 stop:916 length:720 start_codon:yes stop_codon:yes gene_type:complete